MQLCIFGTRGTETLSCRGSLTPAVDNGYPSAHTALLTAGHQHRSFSTAWARPRPGVHLHPVPISLALRGCSYCLHSLLGDLFPIFIYTELEHSSPPHAITASHSPRKNTKVFLV